MIRKFKTLGIAFVAVLAMGAFAASAAQAVVIQSETGKYPATVTAEASGIGEHFKTEAGSVECEKSSYHGVLNEASEELEVSPTYTGCTAFFGFASATIHMNGCEYQFHHTVVHTSTVPKTYTSHVYTVCPPGKVIEITAGTCRATVGSQGPLTTVDMTDVGSGETGDVQIKPTIKGIKYTVTQDGFLCPFGGTGAKEGGEYTSSGYITAKATGGLGLN